MKTVNLHHGGHRGSNQIGIRVFTSVSSVPSVVDIFCRGIAAPTSVLILLAVSFGEAHKPVTSKYTFNEHVFPIVRDRCGACHVDGGVAPMSLMTYADARPWAESIRAELVAGRMPPAQAENWIAEQGVEPPPQLKFAVVTPVFW